VTGVQTCALPIFAGPRAAKEVGAWRRGWQEEKPPRFIRSNGCPDIRMSCLRRNAAARPARRMIFRAARNGIELPDGLSRPRIKVAHGSLRRINPAIIADRRTAHD